MQEMRVQSLGQEDPLAEAMANYMYLATFSTKEELDQFFSDSVAVW